MTNAYPDTTTYDYILSLERIGAKRLAKALLRLPELPGYTPQDPSRTAYGQLHRAKLGPELQSKA